MAGDLNAGALCVMALFGGQVDERAEAGAMFVADVMQLFVRKNEKK